MHTTTPPDLSAGDCRQHDPDLMFPMPKDYQQAAHAKAVCAGCPVRMPCLEYALARGIDDGIWGGLDEKERRRVRQRQAEVTRRAS